MYSCTVGIPQRESKSTPGRVTGPLGPRRALASALRELREGRGQTLNDVAHDLRMSTSKLSRLENAQGKPNARDIQDLIQYYEIAGTRQAERLQEWVEAADRRGWWTDYDDEVIGPLGPHLAYEVDAAVERVYTIPFVPVLLQTLDYAQAVFRDMERRPSKEITQLLEMRLRRQGALRSRDGLKPLRLIAVTHETALRQVVGSPQIMREQLDVLVERSAAPNVDLRILPFSAKPVFSMTCMYAYFEYDDAGESDIVNIETPAGFFSVSDADHVKRYRAAHNTLMRTSLSASDSVEFIRSIRDNIS
jgi:transcriptional regulator with XRE-family HTH domain